MYVVESNYCQSLAKNKNSRLMLVLSDNEENAIQLTDFNVELAIQKLEQGYAIAPFWRDRIYEKLQNSIKDFHTSQGDRTLRKAR